MSAEETLRKLDIKVLMDAVEDPEKRQELLRSTGVNEGDLKAYLEKPVNISIGNVKISDVPRKSVIMGMHVCC